MGLFDRFKKLVVGNSSETLPTQPAVNIKKHSQPMQQHGITTQVIHNIPTEVAELMWFFDGPMKNLDAETEEPSGISFRLPVKKASAPTRMGYWPSYHKMSPTERYSYLNWLTNVDQPIDIGYVFVFFYGLERMIATPKHDAAVKMIHRLKEHHNESGSFSSYSDEALAYAALLYHDPTPLQYIRGTNTSMLILSKATFDHRLTADEIMSSSRGFGWDNTRYIKNEHELFEHNLLVCLQNLYKQDYYPIPNQLDQVPRTQLHLANLSIATDERVIDLGIIDGYHWTTTMRIPKRIDIPDFSQSKIISRDIQQLLKIAHEKTKEDLAKMRKNGERPKAAAKKPSRKKRINPDTGYRLSTEKAIACARELYKSTIAVHPQQLTGNPDYDEEMRIVDHVLPHYRLGDLQYKLGEWKKAETEWISILDLMGALAAEKLAIMYHKQHRYKDEMEILSAGMKVSQRSKVYPIPDKFADRLIAASEFYVKHSTEDESETFHSASGHKNSPGDAAHMTKQN